MMIKLLLTTLALLGSTSANSEVGRVTFFSGNNGTDQKLCDLAWTVDGLAMGKNKFSWNFKDDDKCKNDEAKSVVINNAVKGTIISFYDRTSFYQSSNGSFQQKGSKHDDYTVITIKKDITDPITIGTFEKSFSNDFVNVKFNKGPWSWWFFSSGLDGKVSMTTVDISNIATERIFGSFFGNMYGVDGGWSTWSEWGDCSATCAEGQKTRTRNCTNPPPKNGGKDCRGEKKETQACSHITFCSGELTLYSSNGNKGNKVCTLTWEHGKKNWNFNNYKDCKNNMARSVTINQANKGATIALYESSDFFNSSKGMEYDDYAVIQVKKDITKPVEISTFEKSYSNDFVNVHFARDDGLFGLDLLTGLAGLDGKVSLVTVDSP